MQVCEGSDNKDGSIAFLVIRNGKKVHLSEQKYFSDDDLQGVDSPHEDALIVSVIILCSFSP
ncbi:hypothetical protein FRX31_015047 [Thalictrum thalictroides]|uniref:Uncharacterized protein n=1 Tax=Thalictrum thalictroides TaxID=46969 RepID=A0A7J6WD50_THATH|nr:hypothetical protein FRX31_015047 [Thalictrum thalictroides]